MQKTTTDSHVGWSTLRLPYLRVRLNKTIKLLNNLEELGARDALLHNHPRDRDHRKAAVVQLLRLHRLQRLRVLGLQACADYGQVAPQLCCRLLPT